MPHLSDELDELSKIKDGAQRDEFAVLERVICRQHSALQLFIKEQMNILNSNFQSHSEQMKLVNLQLRSLVQMNGVNSDIQDPSDELLDAFQVIKKDAQERGHGANGSTIERPATVDSVPMSEQLPLSLSRAKLKSMSMSSGQNSASSTDLGGSGSCMDDPRFACARSLNDYGLDTEVEMQQIVTRHLNRSTLCADQTNLHFAQDLFGANGYKSAIANIDQIQMALEKDKLPHLADARSGRSSVEEPERTSFLARLLQMPYFEYFACLVILVNSCFIVMACDYAVQHPNDPKNSLIAAVETIFQAYYILEMFAKLGVHRFYFFLNQDAYWNMFDFVLVMAAIYDMFSTNLMPRLDDDLGSSQNSEFSWNLLRLLRLIRIMKVMRLFRVVRFFSELNVLLKVVASSLKSLFWCTLMLVVFIYMFAVIFVHGTASYLALKDADEGIKAKLLKMFGSVGLSMLSLSKACSGGEDWGPLGETLYELGTLYYSFYILFIGFTFLALMNILTGLFVDRTFKAVAADHDGVALDRLYCDRNVVSDLCRLYCAMTGEDINSGKTIPRIMFRTCMSSPVMRARMAALDLQIWDSMQFFEMLVSMTQSQELDLQSWVTGCMQLRGSASRISIQALHADVHRLKKMLQSMTFQNFDLAAQENTVESMTELL